MNLGEEDDGSGRRWWIWAKMMNLGEDDESGRRL